MTGKRLLRRFGAVAGLVLAAALCSQAQAQVQAQTIDVCDRTPQIRDKIISDLSAAACEEVSVQGLAGIIEFDLSGSTLDGLNIPRLTAVKAGDFDGFDGLVTLNMSSNRLTTLPPDWAGDIKDTLSRLDLSYNRVEYLLPGMFEGLAGLGAGNPHRRNPLNPSEILPHVPAPGERGGSLFLQGNRFFENERVDSDLVMIPEVRVKRVVSETELEVTMYYAPGMPIPSRVTINASGVDSSGKISTEFVPGATETSPPFTVVRADGETATLRISGAAVPRLIQAMDCGYGDDDTWYDDAGRTCYSGFQIRGALAAPLVYDGATPAPPRVSTVVFLPAPRYIADGYLAGAEHVVANVVFDRPVLAESGVPTLELDVGGRKRVAEYVPRIGAGSGGFRSPDVPVSHIYSFLYSFSADDEDSDGVSIHSANALKLGSAAMISQFEQPVDLNLSGFLEPHADRKVIPPVASVEITSEPKSEDGVYTATDVEAEQEEIVVEVVFSTEVTVMGAPGLNPGLNLEIGNKTRLATYDAGLNPTGTTTRLVFRYKPVAGDEDGNGISIRTDALVLPEGVRIHVLGVNLSPKLPSKSRIGGIAYAIRNDRNHRVAVSQDGVFIRIRLFLEGALE